MKPAAERNSDLPEWRYGPTECANADCRKDLRRINPIYTIAGKDIGFCCQACRATLTKEQVRRAPDLADDVAAPLTLSKEHSAKQPRAERTIKATSANRPVKVAAGGTGTLHIVRPDQKFHGQRAVVWGLIKEGMTVQSLYEACAKAGINGKGTLRAIMVVGKGCIEIKQ